MGSMFSIPSGMAPAPIEDHSMQGIQGANPNGQLTSPLDAQREMMRRQMIGQMLAGLGGAGRNTPRPVQLPPIDFIWPQTAGMR